MVRVNDLASKKAVPWNIALSFPAHKYLIGKGLSARL
jgi:hypothetical protein